MKQALMLFFGGAALLLLILSLIEPIQKAFNPDLSMQTPLSDSVVVRTDFDVKEEIEVVEVAEANDELKSGKARLLVLLESEPALGEIIEENIQLIGQIEYHTAFQHHQAILKLIQEAENVQPISVVCTGLVCNLAIYANSAERAAEFSQKNLFNLVHSYPLRVRKCDRSKKKSTILFILCSLCRRQLNASQLAVTSVSLL